MTRQMTTGYFHFKDQKDYSYNPAFGKHTRTKRDVDTEVKRLYNEKGIKVEEVGDAEPQGEGPKRSDVDLQDAAEHFRALKKNPHAGV
jgi:hypothetical protein